MNQSTKLIQKLKQRDLERQLLLSQSWKSDNLMGRNREESILEKLPLLKGNKNYIAF